MLSRCPGCAAWAAACPWPTPRSYSAAGAASRSAARYKLQTRVGQCVVSSSSSSSTFTNKNLFRRAPAGPSTSRSASCSPTPGTCSSSTATRTCSRWPLCRQGDSYKQRDYTPGVLLPDRAAVPVAARPPAPTLGRSHQAGQQPRAEEGVQVRGASVKQQFQQLHTTGCSILTRPTWWTPSSISA